MVGLAHVPVRLVLAAEPLASSGWDPCDMRQQSECLLLLALVATFCAMTTLPKISLPKIPTIDLSKVPGFDKLPKVDLPKIQLPEIHSIDLTSLDLSKVNPAVVLQNPVVKQATEIGYTAVGFAVLGVQKVQVRRRELIDSIKARRNTAQ